MCGLDLQSAVSLALWHANTFDFPLRLYPPLPLCKPHLLVYDTQLLDLDGLSVDGDDLSMETILLLQLSTRARASSFSQLC